MSSGVGWVEPRIKYGIDSAKPNDFNCEGGVYECTLENKWFR